MPSNDAHKFAINLATARRYVSIIPVELRRHRPFTKLIVITVGAGTYNLLQRFRNGRTVSYSETELSDGLEMDREFIDLLINNAAQILANPMLIVEWKINA